MPTETVYILHSRILSSATRRRTPYIIIIYHSDCFLYLCCLYIQIRILLVVCKVIDRCFIGSSHYLVSYVQRSTVIRNILQIQQEAWYSSMVLMISQDLIRRWLILRVYVQLWVIYLLQYSNTRIFVYSQMKSHEQSTTWKRCGHA